MRKTIERFSCYEKRYDCSLEGAVYVRSGAIVSAGNMTKEPGGSGLTVGALVAFQFLLDKSLKFRGATHSRRRSAGAVALR